MKILFRLLLMFVLVLPSCKKKSAEECVTCIELNSHDTANEYCAPSDLVDQYISILKSNEDSTQNWLCTKH